MSVKGRISWKLAFSYVVDWIFIIIIVAIGGGLSYLPPVRRVFSPTDISISYPYVPDLISPPLLYILTVLLPAAIILAITALFIPLPSTRRPLSSPSFWRRKLWELNAGLMGLALSAALAILLNQVFKTTFGRHRPDFLSRCQVDRDALNSNLTSAETNSTGVDLFPTQIFLDVTACTQTDKSRLDDGYRSFFSGHACSSFAGLLYLSLWLALKFNVVLPVLSPRAALHEPPPPISPVESEHRLPTYLSPVTSPVDATSLAAEARIKGYRHSAAAPPTWGALLLFAPLLLASWIVSTRYAEYKHHGFDLLTGVLVGCLCAAVGFRWFHGDVVRGQGWTWGPRAGNEAFFLVQGRGRGEERGGPSGRVEEVKVGEPGSAGGGRAETMGNGYGDSSPAYATGNGYAAPGSDVSAGRSTVSQGIGRAR